MKKIHDHSTSPGPEASTSDALALAVVAFDAVASDPTWMARPLAIFSPQVHPSNAPEMIFYNGARKLGARVAGAAKQERRQIALDCHHVLNELVARLRERVAADARVESLAAQTAPWTSGADLLIESSGASFVAGFLEGGLMRESQQRVALGFGGELDGAWMEARESLDRNDAKQARALVEAEAESSLMLSDFLAKALPSDHHFKAGAPIGLLGVVAACPRYPQGLPVMRSRNRDAVGKFFQCSAIAMRLGEQIGADLGPLMNSGMLQEDHWEGFAQLWGGFPSKKLMLAEAEASLGAMKALREAQEIASSTGPAARRPSIPAL
jgi:hypothetical protein